MAFGRSINALAYFSNERRTKLISPLDLLSIHPGSYPLLLLLSVSMSEMLSWTALALVHLVRARVGGNP